ncbi:hypothetical protein ACLOJK_002248 [Asimina triloba]
MMQPQPQPQPQADKSGEPSSSSDATDCVLSSNAPAPIIDGYDWEDFKDDDIMQQHSAIRAEEAEKIPFVGDEVQFQNPSFLPLPPSLDLDLRARITDLQIASPRKLKIAAKVVVFGLHIRLEALLHLIACPHSLTIGRPGSDRLGVPMQEPLSALAAEYQSGSSILQEKIKEHILETQDKVEVERVTASVEQCKKTLQSLGYADFTFEDFFALFLEQLESVLQGKEDSIRFVTSGEIRRRSEFFAPFILGLTNGTVDQFCKTSVEPMGEESDHVHIIALSDALGVPIRVVYLDRSSCDTGGISVNHHDFIPGAGDPQGATSSNPNPSKPFLTFLYRPGHYDILYPK